MLAVIKDVPPIQVDRFPLRVQRFGKEGWFFVSCDGIPGLSAFGPELKSLFTDIEIAGAELLRSRGTNVIRLKIEAVPDTDDNTWAPAEKYELMAEAA